MTLLRSNEVAAKLGVSLQTARRWMREGVIPAVRIGLFWYAPSSELEKMFEQSGERHA